MMCIQGMLHRIEGKESENTDANTAAIERAQTLRARYYAFTQGNFEPLLADERSPEREPQHKPRTETPNKRTSEGRPLSTAKRARHRKQKR